MSDAPWCDDEENFCLFTLLPLQFFILCVCVCVWGCTGVFERAFFLCTLPAALLHFPHYFFFYLSVCSPPPALPPKKRQSAPSPTRVAVVAPMSRGSSLPCSVHRQVNDQCSQRSRSATKPRCLVRVGKTIDFFSSCSSRTTSRSSCRGVFPAAASLTAATHHACRLVAAWGS